MELNHAKALTHDVTCGLAPPLLGCNTNQTSLSASIQRQLRKGCQHLFTATYLKAKLRPISSFTFTKSKSMSIYINLNNVIAYGTVTRLHIRQDFQKRWVSFALDDLGEPSFWRKCPFLCPGILKFSISITIFIEFCMQTTTHTRNPPLLTQTGLLSRKEWANIWNLCKLQHCT